MKKGFMFLISLFIANPLIAQTLNTPTYKIVITCQSPEYEVGCSKATYQGTNKKTGSTITLQGSQVMSLCADGVTPCHSLGYKFINDKTVYFVSEDGILTVTAGSKELLNETGQWDN
ncbi:MAG: hypothetical protein EPN84_04160 [Legionella sp.]|nr:MAG: hypothetical protein EPN84_04160 [Legionella sp.]